VASIEIARYTPMKHRAVIGVAPGTDGKEVSDGKPSRSGLPGGSEHHRARHVTPIRWHLDIYWAKSKRTR
jgi:hypothetical protein